MSRHHAASDPVRFHAVFFGRVQGVGFRATARALAAERGVTGWVQNEPDGSVRMEAQACQALIDDLLAAIETARPVRSRTLGQVAVIQGEAGFEIRS